MEASTTVRKMLAGNRLYVPDYQRAYSWDTELVPKSSPKQVNTFISDLEEYNQSTTKSAYYFGHFLFEEKGDDRFSVIDGQQRLTTIIIFLSALFTRLKSFRILTEAESTIFEDMVKRKSIYRFETVGYDSQLFKDYVIDQIKKDHKGLKTESAKRIVNAFDYFMLLLSEKEEAYLLKMLSTIEKASCTTHPVDDESKAIQMFIFQNNRGKKPSNLEIIKAQFMFNVHLYAGEEKDALMDEIRNRFETIYKSISAIEYNIDEDDVLGYTLKVYFNSLWESNPNERINKSLNEANPISFIKSFTHSLTTSFEHLTTFFGEDERDHIQIHSLVTLGRIGIALPFVIKAYRFGLKTADICALCSKLETLVLRHRLIGTRAEITSRLNEVFQQFTVETPEIQPIINKIDWMKAVTPPQWWWAYWNNQELERSIQGKIDHSTARYLLWKYENYLEGQGKAGYTPTRFNKIIDPELEHIAPQTPTNGEPLAAGYCEYDDEFKQQYIDCLGNYLLLSKPHNGSVGNKPFADKRSTYNHLAQQREIQEMTKNNIAWTKELILERKNKIVQFLLENV